MKTPILFFVILTLFICVVLGFAGEHKTLDGSAPKKLGDVKLVQKPSYYGGVEANQKTNNMAIQPKGQKVSFCVDEIVKDKGFISRNQEVEEDVSVKVPSRQRADKLTRIGGFVGGTMRPVSPSYVTEKVKTTKHLSAFIVMANTSGLATGTWLEGYENEFKKSGIMTNGEEQLIILIPPTRESE